MKSYSRVICPFATLAVRIPAGMWLFHIQCWFCGVKEGWVTSSRWDFKNFGAQSPGSALTIAEAIRRYTSTSEGTNEAVSGGKPILHSCHFPISLLWAGLESTTKDAWETEFAEARPQHHREEYRRVGLGTER